MKKTTRRIVLLLSALLTALSLFVLCACTITPENPNDTDKSKLTVTFDDSHTVYEGDSLDSIKPYITVTYTDKDGKDSVVTNYTLSGTITKGESKITVKYDNLTYTLDITVSKKTQTLPTTYTVTFKADNVTVDTQTYTATNINITEPTVPEKTGYNGKWENYTLTTGNITVNAVYTANQYTVTFDYSGATSGNEQQTLTTTYDQPIGTLPTPTKEGCEFLGWKYNDEMVTSKFVWTTNSDATFVAQWKRATSTEGLKYTLNPDGNSYSVSKGTATDTDILIPSTYNDKPVTSIDDSAFYNCSSLTSVTIPDSVTCIGNYAFRNCSKLADINYLGTIESWCNIQGLNRLMDTGYSQSNKTLSLNGVPVTELVIPSTVTSIPSYAFAYTNITSVTIPDSVTSIGYSSFDVCRQLVNINVTSIASWCKIEGLDNLMYKGYDSPNSKTLSLNGVPVTEIVIPSTVKSIPDYAFTNFTNITSITIPDSVTSIGSDAFYGCTKLQYNEYDNALYLGNDNNPYLVLVKAKDKSITSVAISATAKTICNSAFNGCNSLTSVIIGNSVTSIGMGAFWDCSSLTIYCEALSKPSGWNSNWNGGSTYSYCPIVWDCNNNDKDSGGYVYAIIDGIRYSLKDNVATVIEQPRNITEAIIPQSVIYKGNEYTTSISYDAFEYCSSLTSITIPSSITNISEITFFHCSSLANINYLGSIESWCNIQGLNYLMYNNYGITSNKTISINGEQVTELVIPSTVTSIPDFAFYQCTNITNVTFEENSQCTSIGWRAFDGCTNLQYNEYDNALYLGNDNNPYLVLVKAKDKSITSCAVNENTKVIADWAFDGCRSLTSVTIPNGITSVGYAAFGEYNELQYYEYGNARYLGNADNPYVVLLSVDQSITSFTINKNTKIIYMNAFYHCNSLTSITIPDSITDIGYSTFRDCSSLSSVTIGNSVSSIDDSAFYNCSSLTSIILPSSVTIIDNNAFSGCNNLKTVYYNGTAEDWDKISVDFGNSTLISATRYYYSESEPADNGNYWHYVDGVATVWKKEA